MQWTVIVLLMSSAAATAAAQERLVIIGPDHTLLAGITGGASSVTIPPELDGVLRRADVHARLTHNHPNSSGLSAADLEQLDKPGVDVVEAVGADGSRYEASRGPAYRPDQFETGQYGLAESEVRRRLLKGHIEMNEANADNQVAHLTAIALHKEGVLVYHATLSTERRRSYDRNAVAFGYVTEGAAAVVRKQGALTERPR